MENFNEFNVNQYFATLRESCIGLYIKSGLIEFITKYDDEAGIIRTFKVDVLLGVIFKNYNANKLAGKIFLFPNSKNLYDFRLSGEFNLWYYKNIHKILDKSCMSLI